MTLRRSKQNLSHFKLLTGDLGKLYPIGCVEVLPGDTFRHQAQSLIRMQPLLTPLLHPVHVSIRHFYVPNRIIWDGWEDFITGKKNDPIPTVPNTTTADTLLDYMGIPPGAAENTYNALPLMGVNKIWNEFFRDQDIDTERALTDTSVPNVRWEKDYATTVRQYAQAGGALGEAASIIFNQDVPVRGIAGDNPIYNTPGRNQVYESDGQQRDYASYKHSGSDTISTNSLIMEENPNNPGFPNIRIPAGSTAGSVDINEWRRAMALQKYREHRNRFGSRYIDYLRYLGLTPSDGRLDRPEYLGGGRNLVNFSEVLQTVDSQEVPLGSQGGHGIASNRTNSYKRFFEENGYVHSFLFVRPRSMYSNSVHRTFLRQQKDDFWQKENEMLGEQPTFTKELYEPAPLATIFGYQGRHQDYRYQPSAVTSGMRRSEYNVWHMSREFTQAPSLNPAFLECDPTKRIWRSSNDPQMYILAQHRISARRLVSKIPRTF